MVGVELFGFGLGLTAKAQSFPQRTQSFYHLRYLRKYKLEAGYYHKNLQRILAQGLNCCTLNPSLSERDSIILAEPLPLIG